ncbi:MAG: hypothetical protein JO037_04040 [Actinobacteria bacterium]|nr:hypothetical protein [Actinomycetota bacterium]
MITADLRRVLAELSGDHTDPRLRPGPVPGSYASGLAFRLARAGHDPRELAAVLAARLERRPWITAAEVTGPGFVTVTVTRDTLARLAVRVAQAGPACAVSDALAGRTVTVPAETGLAAAPDWPRARGALAAQVTARLAAAADAKVIIDAERTRPPALLPRSPGPAGRPGPATPSPAPPGRSRPVVPAASVPSAPFLAGSGPVADAIRYAGEDAVRFALARTPPGGPWPRPAIIARHVLANPAYAVRYAHAAAAAVLRWAAALGIRPAGPEEFRPRLLADPGELALLDALSWLPERVAVAARRGRPGEFAGYLEELAARTIGTMSTTGFTAIASISSERLWLADAARTGLAAGLGLLGVGAPNRL